MPQGAANTIKGNGTRIKSDLGGFSRIYTTLNLKSVLIRRIRANPRAIAVMFLSYFKPKTSCMSYSPGCLPTTHLAARTEPRENMSRVMARWEISMRSPWPMK